MTRPSPPSPPSQPSTGEVLDPHTAVGVAAAARCRRFGDIPLVTLATAHPAKFGAAIEQALGEPPSMPERLAAITDLDEHFDLLAADLAAVEPTSAVA